MPLGRKILIAPCILTPIVGLGNNSTEHNDSWLRFPDADDFYGQKGSSIVYPRGSGKTPLPNGSGGDGWFKIYLSNSLDWTWITSTSDNDAHSIFVKFDNPGEYTMQISGRSKEHAIDRIVLYKQGNANPTALTYGETCTNNDNLTNTEELAIQDMEVAIYPNPAKEQVTLSLSNFKAKKAVIQIVNLLGQVQLQKMFNKLPNRLNLEVSTLQNGIYYLTIKIGHSTVITKKVMVS